VALCGVVGAGVVVGVVGVVLVAAAVLGCVVWLGGFCDWVLSGFEAL